MQLANSKLNNSVIVIGGGISGLLTGYRLSKQNIDVTILEKDIVVGGTMKTVHDNGWLIETGPNSALETTPLIGEVIKNLGIESQLIYANEQSSKRYIVKNGSLMAVPMDPLSFIRTKLWSTGGKLRLLKEPFIERGSSEETIAQFVERRLGKEFLDYAINPFVAGVYAGNPETLSVRYAFPKLYALEEKYGGLIKGMIGSRKERKARKEIAKDRAKLFSFYDGMQSLPLKISEALDESIITESTVESVIPMKVGNRPIYTVTFLRKGERSTLEAPVVVLASPSDATASIIEKIDPETASALRSIYYPPVVEVFLGFAKEQVNRNLGGFGFLVPAVERKRILGTIWSSSLFPNRSPKNHIALTTFVGGSRQPELTELDDDELLEIVLDDLKILMQIESKPVYSKIVGWKKAIPQYNLGYGNILDKITRFEDNFRGTFVTGNYRGGIAVGDCFINSDKTVEKIVNYLNKIDIS
ncbi:MAG: protoporphyrinogen oxidase [Ignavibacteriales bacterium]|nr:protoporphyrinogen oxidase [Ignavibacteriales bacterium]